MSYPIGSQPPAAARPRRPAAVMAAAALLAVMAVAGVANAVVGLLSLQGIVNRFRSAADATDASARDVGDLVSALRVSVAIGLVIALVVVVLLAALAVGILRGSAGARVGTWVVCGLGALCGGCGLAILVGQRLVPLDVDPAEAATLRALSDAYPGWWLALNGALLAAQALGYLLVALLLAVPAANRFFRRRPLPVQLGYPAAAEPHPANPLPPSPPPSHHPSQS